MWSPFPPLISKHVILSSAFWDDSVCTMWLLNPSHSIPGAPEQCWITWHHWVETRTGGGDGHPAWFQNHVSKTASENPSCTPEPSLGGAGWEKSKVLNYCSVPMDTVFHWYEQIGPWFILPLGWLVFKGKKFRLFLGKSSSSLPKVKWWHFSLPASYVILSISNFQKKKKSLLKTVIRKAHVSSFS